MIYIRFIPKIVKCQWNSVSKLQLIDDLAIWSFWIEPTCCRNYSSNNAYLARWRPQQSESVCVCVYAVVPKPLAIMNKNAYVSAKYYLLSLKSCSIYGLSDNSISSKECHCHFLNAYSRHHRRLHQVKYENS